MRLTYSCRTFYLSRFAPNRIVVCTKPYTCNAVRYSAKLAEQLNLDIDLLNHLFKTSKHEQAAISFPIAASQYGLRSSSPLTNSTDWTKPDQWTHHGTVGHCNAEGHTAVPIMQTACRLQEHAAGLDKSWTRLFTSCEQNILGSSCEKVRRKAEECGSKMAGMYGMLRLQDRDFSWDPWLV